MDDLVAFLNARYDEAAAVAVAAQNSVSFLTRADLPRWRHAGDQR